jgi:hypothetical protein
MNEVADQTISINVAQYVDGYKLQLLFNDGTKRLVDFEPFLSKSKHPDVRKYLNLNNFKSFSIVDGDLDWNDFELCFPIYDLYKGEI